MPTTVDDLAQHAMVRLEEFIPSQPVFWSLTQEGYTGVVEALCEALLLVGRPVNLVNVPFTIQPNQWQQTLPVGMLCVTDLQGPSTQVWKFDLRAMDYQFTGLSSSDWENDVASGQTIFRWFPLGLGGQFGVWPSVSHAQSVTITGLQSPVQSSWPFSGSQTASIHSEFDQAIEKYCASYCRLKEGGAEFQLGVSLYQEFLSEMQRLTTIENRRDPFIFGRATGAAADRGQRPDQR